MTPIRPNYLEMLGFAILKKIEPKSSVRMPKSAECFHIEFDWCKCKCNDSAYTIHTDHST